MEVQDFVQRVYELDCSDRWPYVSGVVSCVMAIHFAQDFEALQRLGLVKEIYLVNPEQTYGRRRKAVCWVGQYAHRMCFPIDSLDTEFYHHALQFDSGEGGYACMKELAKKVVGAHALQN